MGLLISEVSFSKKDKKINITIPHALNEDLAELIGIILGDGHLAYQSRESSRFYSIRITCNLYDDNLYFDNIINPLFTKLFNTTLTKIVYKDKNFFVGVKCSKAIVTFLNTNFSIPIGNKSSKILIPEKILKSKTDILLSFVRGLADTDFSLSFKRKKEYHNYPVLKGSLKSKIILEQLNKILIRLGFKPFLSLNEKNFDKRFNKNYERHSIYLSGVKNIERWFCLIGFNNPKHFTKYKIWKKFGFCPPNTNLKERVEILSKKRDPYSYYSGPARI